MPKRGKFLLKLILTVPVLLYYYIGLQNYDENVEQPVSSVIDSQLKELSDRLSQDIKAMK